MTMTRETEIINWAINKLQSYEKEKKIYNLSAIILSVLDVLCGVITIFYTGMLATSIVASIVCGTVWGARFIQLIKTEKLAKSLKTLNIASTLSLGYLVTRKKRSEIMKVKSINWLSAILTILGVACVAVCKFVPEFAQYMDYVIYALFLILPADLYAIFNNAKTSTEEMQAKKDAKAIKEAEAKAKAELKAKQEAELKALTEQKLNEAKQTEVTEQK